MSGLICSQIIYKFVFRGGHLHINRAQSDENSREKGSSGHRFYRATGRTVGMHVVRGLSERRKMSQPECGFEKHTARHIGGFRELGQGRQHQPAEYDIVEGEDRQCEPGQGPAKNGISTSRGETHVYEFFPPRRTATVPRPDADRVLIRAQVNTFVIKNVSG